MTSSQASSPVGDGRRRPLLWALAAHRWLGRVLVFYLIVVFATGSLLVFADETAALFSPQMRRHAAPGGAAPASFGALYDAIRAAAPDLGVYRIDAPKSPLLAASAEIRHADGSGGRLWIDPVTAEVQGATPGMDYHGILVQLHSSLMLGRRPTTLLAEAVVLFLAAQLVLGLISQRRIWRSASRLPQLSGPARSRWGSLHRWSILWALPVLCITVLTGMIYLGGSLDIWPQIPGPPATEQRAAALPEGFDGAAVDRGVAVAESALPGLRVTDVQIPGVRRQPLVVRGDLTARIADVTANTVAIDPATMQVLKAWRGEDFGFARRLTLAADPLHFGRFGGLPTRILWLVSGLLALTAAVSGLMVAAWRTGPGGRASVPAAFRAIFLPARIALALALAGMLALLVWTLL